jgi:hypothetical protein
VVSFKQADNGKTYTYNLHAWPWPASSSLLLVLRTLSVKLYPGAPGFHLELLYGFD